MACDFWDVQCKAEEGISDLAGSAVEQFVQALADGCKMALGLVNTFWMKVPSPTVASGSGQSWQGSGVLTGLQQDLMPITATVAIIAFALALLRISFSPERAGEGMRAILRQFVAVLAATLPILAVAQLLIGFGDKFSPWIIEQATGQPASEGFKDVLMFSVFGAEGVPDSGLGLWLVLFLVGIIGSAVQAAFMVFRGAAILILFVLLPPVAAGAATEEGWQRYKKMLMIILGFVLYKPVAAVIYATGLKLMTAQDDEVMNAIYGLTVILMAALALPALIKFLMPTAAVGSSSAFSGGAAVGAVAGGAAVVGLAAATGGVGAAGGAATASGAGSAGTGGTAAAGEGGGAAGGATGGAAGPGGGSGGGTGPGGGASPDPGASGAGGGQDLVGTEAGGSSSGSGGSAGGASSTSPSSATETSGSTGSGSESASGAESTSTQSGESTSAPSPSSSPAAQGATSQSAQRHGEAVRQLAQDASERVQRAGNEAAEGADQ